MYKKMLVPLDGSKLAEIVLPYATRLVAQFGLKVTFLHVCDASESTSFFMCESYIQHVAESVQKELAAGGERQRYWKSGRWKCSRGNPSLCR